MRWHTVSLPASIIQASSLDNFSPKQNKQAVSAAMGAVHGLEWLLMAEKGTSKLNERSATSTYLPAYPS